MEKKIFFVDRYISYSTNLFTSLEEACKANEFDLSFIGPKKENLEKFSTNVIHNAKRVWSSENYNKEMRIMILINKMIRLQTINH